MADTEKPFLVKLMMRSGALCGPYRCTKFIHGPAGKYEWESVPNDSFPAVLFSLDSSDVSVVEIEPEESCP